MDSTVHAEFMGLRKGLLVTVALWSATSHSFMFESDCKSAVAWVANSISTLWHFHNVLCKCCHVLGWELLGRFRI